MEGRGHPPGLRRREHPLTALEELAGDKTWGLTDCVSMEVMSDRKLRDAATSDAHFEQAGFKALLR